MKVTKATAYALHALMYMVRHATQLPVTTRTVAKAEGIPAGYLARIFQRLVKSHFVKVAKNKNRGYVFDMPPEEISLLELLEAFEGKSLFVDCLLKHCDCGGTPDNCCIYAQWISATKKIKKLLEKTTLVDAAWHHPEHRFYSLPESLKPTKSKSKHAIKSETPVE